MKIIFLELELWRRKAAQVFGSSFLGKHFSLNLALKEKKKSTFSTKLFHLPITSNHIFSIKRINFNFFHQNILPTIYFPTKIFFGKPDTTLNYIMHLANNWYL